MCPRLYLIRPAFCSFKAPSVTPSPPDAEHIGDRLLGHGEPVSAQAIEAQQQPAPELLIERVMPVEIAVCAICVSACV
jgi:hypothetical protein